MNETIITNLSQFGSKCTIINETLNMNPILYAGIVIYFFLIIGLLYFFDFELKKKWRKNEVKEVPKLPNGHGE